jgi:predicted phosphodiesterase
MRVALLSDIHGNALALDAVLADLAAHPADRAVCLGDAVQGGPEPAEVVARLRALGCPIVMGNADHWLLRGIKTDDLPVEPERERQLADTRAWSLSRLSAEDRAFIAAFTPTVEIELEGGRRLLGFHGSPGSYDDTLMPDASEERFQRLLGGNDAHVLAGGHTHLQQIRRFGLGFFCNPGSIGMVYSMRPDGRGARAHAWAEYAVLSSEGAIDRLEFRRVPYDRDELARRIRASGRPHAEAAIQQYME